METFGARLRKKRREKGVSASALANSVGCSRPTIEKMETGERGSSLERLPLIAKKLGCRIDDLFPEMDNELDELEM